MKIWTLVHDSDSGTSTEVFTDEAKLNARALAIIAEDWDEPEHGKMPEGWEQAWEDIGGTTDWWLSVQDHEIEVPEPGLTKREAFAAQALAGLLAGIWANPNDLSISDKVAAEAAVSGADALIEALK